MNEILCGLPDLETTGGKGILLKRNGSRLAVFVVKDGDCIVGYVNSCPHARLPLNFHENRFFDRTGLRLFCTNHGATFDIATGLCLRGPCKGDSLTPFPVEIRDGFIISADGT